MATTWIMESVLTLLLKRRYDDRDIDVLAQHCLLKATDRIPEE